jgi:hypothetical protein
MDLAGPVTELLSRAGPLWLPAVGVTFVAMICESSRPKAIEGEDRPRAGVLRAASLALGFLTPFLLFIDVFWSVAAMDAVADVDMAALVRAAREAILIVALVIMAALFVLPSIVAAIIRSAAPSAGRALYAAAPILTIAAFAFVVFVTRENVMAAFDLITMRLGAA